MNSQSVAMPAPAAPPTANSPAPAAPVPAATVSPVSSGPSIVTNIPVHAPQAAAPASEDAELDKIMHDVGQELKKEDVKPEHHGLLGFLHHEPKPLVKVNNTGAKPAPAPVAVQAAPSIAQPIPVAMAAPAAPLPQEAPLPQAQPQAAATPAKTKAQRHVPVFVIFVAICVTGFLVAAAIAAYR